MNTPQLELISHRLCPYVQRARIVLAEKGLDHRITFIDLADKPDWFAEISPLGKVPVLLVNGRVLFESSVIAEYLDEISNGSLLPADPWRRAQNRSWIEFASSMLSKVAQLYNAPDLAAFERTAAELRGRFRRLDEELGVGPYFNGLFFSLVDAAFAPLFRYFDVIGQYLDLDLFDGLSRLHAWRMALRNRTSVQTAVVGEYPQLLLDFLAARQSVLGRLMRQGQQRQRQRLAG